MAQKFIPRDISWLSFNGRVLQEAADKTVPIASRINFLGIFSNNLDEFFRVRVAGLKRALIVDEKEAKEIFFEKPQVILDQINSVVIKQQKKFNTIWNDVRKEMAKESVYIKTHEDLSIEQQAFVRAYYEDEVEPNIIPLLLEEHRNMPYIRDKSLYLGISMRKEEWQYETKYAVIELPTSQNGRFKILPSPSKEVHVILLEDIIKYNLPYIFSYFGFDSFSVHAFKVTKDAEFDIDNDIQTSFAEKIAKAVKSRRKGKPTRFVFDHEMDKGLVEFLIKKLNISKRDSIIPGSKIHNFKDFMNFPHVFKTNKPIERTSFLHPDLAPYSRVTDMITQKDVLLSFPYHSFVHVIDLLREAAMDPDVISIQITAYRLASNSKIGNALINAVRNGKEVTVMLELRARFDEQNNLDWKEKFETEGVKVLIGVPNKKVHAKLCVIKKRVNNKTIQYGFVSTGNFNEKTAKIYGDHCLMTSNRAIMADINKVFAAIKKPKEDITLLPLKTGKGLVVCPNQMRETIFEHIDTEILEAIAGRKAHIIIKVNSLSDKEIIKKIYDAAKVGVKVEMIIRSIYCATNQDSFTSPIHAISIVDEYLEHARVMYFYNAGDNSMYISSADLMTRNLDHRIEAAVRIKDKKLKIELLDMLKIQLKGNVKTRILDNNLLNKYVTNNKPPFRSQIELYKYLKDKARTA